MSKRVIIFDFDGTIADTVLVFAKVFQEIAHLPEPLTTQQITQLRGLTGPEFMRAFSIPNWRVPYMIFRGKRMIRKYMGDAKPYAGIQELIKSLHAAGIPLYIVSSNSAEIIQKYLVQHDIAHCFKAISGGASPFAKARKMLKLIDMYDIDPATSWCVGDETRDIIASHRVGVKIVSVSWGFNSREALVAKHPDILVDTVPELQKALQAAWKK